MTSAYLKALSDARLMRFIGRKYDRFHFEERVVKRKYLWLALLVGGFLAFVFLGEFVFTSSGREYSTDLNDLRAKFNQDKGKVRLLLLLSPT